MALCPFLLRSVILLFVIYYASAARSSQNNYVIKARVYVDKIGVTKWMQATGKKSNELKREMDSIFLEISENFKSLRKYGLNIQIQLEKFEFIKENIFGQITGSEAVSVFTNWVSTNSYPYDIALLWTGHNLELSRKNHKVIIGEALSGEPCNKRAVGVIEITGTYTDVLVAAHEIGHILGADHDGIKKAKSCKGEVGNIMVANDLYEKGQFEFSSCSANAIKDVIKRLDRDGNNCFRDGKFERNRAPRFGTLMSVDELCQRRVGPTSYAARRAYKNHDEACIYLACVTDLGRTRITFKRTHTPTGIDCGVNKKCNQGKCEASRRGNSVKSDTCPFGEAPQIKVDNYTSCNSLPLEKCDKEMQKACCEKCHIEPLADASVADVVCQELLGPHSALMRGYYPDGYGDKICSKLSCLEKVLKYGIQVRSFEAPDGMNCGRNKSCQDGRCVQDKSGDPNMSDSCPYGDQPFMHDYGKTCEELKNSFYGCRHFTADCCVTCA